MPLYLGDKKIEDGEVAIQHRYTDTVTELPGGGEQHTIVADLDLSQDTVTPESLLIGYTAHNASGQPITGTIPVIDQWDDFSGGNIKALVSHGTEYVIITGYKDPQNNLYSCKIKDTSVTAWEGYWIQRGSVFTCLERYNNQWLMYTAMQGNAANLTIQNYSSSSTQPFVFSLSCLGLPAKPVSGTGVQDFTILGIMKADGTVGNPADCEFYGLNILNSQMQYVKRFVPWLESGVPCIKELISGALFYNSGTGTFDYIDNEGVLHSA